MKITLYNEIYQLSNNVYIISERIHIFVYLRGFIPDRTSQHTLQTKTMSMKMSYSYRTNTIQALRFSCNPIVHAQAITAQENGIVQ